jgi:hypothetical protein
VLDSCGHDRRGSIGGGVPVERAYVIPLLGRGELHINSSRIVANLSTLRDLVAPVLRQE